MRRLLPVKRRRFNSGFIFSAALHESSRLLLLLLRRQLGEELRPLVRALEAVNRALFVRSTDLQPGGRGRMQWHVICPPLPPHVLDCRCVLAPMQLRHGVRYEARVRVQAAAMGALLQASKQAAAEHDAAGLLVALVCEEGGEGSGVGGGGEEAAGGGGNYGKHSRPFFLRGVWEGEGGGGREWAPQAALHHYAPFTTP